MKRGRHPLQDQGSRKKSRTDRESDLINRSLNNVSSIQDEAQQYLLGTARFPVDALTSRWSVGENRNVDRRHVKNICQLFKDRGVRRKDAECHIIVGSTKQHFELMKAHKYSNEWLTGSNEAIPPCFGDWEKVTGCKAELLAGNHRVEALKELLKESAASERWWTAQIYDIGTY